MIRGTGTSPPRWDVAWSQLLLGLLFLLAGISVYVVARPIDSTAIMLTKDVVQRYLRDVPNPFGSLGLFAPDFFHPLAFSLISAALVVGRRAKIAICMVWFIIDLGFEFGQAIGTTWFDFLPEGVATIELIRDIRGYFLSGTFDFYDLLAIGLGSLTAVCIILWQERGRSENKDTITKIPILNN